MLRIYSDFPEITYTQQKILTDTFAKIRLKPFKQHTVPFIITHKLHV